MNTEIHPTTILIVDDSPDVAEVLFEFLKIAGYEVLRAVNGEKAFDILQQQIPDLILLDVMMPGMDGFEVCRRLKADNRTKEIPVIFITALVEAESKVKGFEVGGIDYITKPLQCREVLARITSHLTNRRFQQQLQEERAFFKALAEASFEGIAIHDAGRIVEANQALASLFGYQHQNLLGRNLLDLILPEHRPMAYQKIIRSNDVLPYELRGIKKDGSNFLLEIQTKKILWQGQPLTVTAMRDITSRRELEDENRTLKTSLQERFKFGEMIGKSRTMQEVYEFLARAAATDKNVAIYGESGTGKELAARMIHQLSDRHEKPFVPVNCSAIPESLFESQFFGHRKGAFTSAERNAVGYFEQAQDGTLFLDEVGELTPLMQAKLLRVLNDKIYTPVGSTISRRANVRIIAATNRELRAMLFRGQVREDFFHRIHVLAVNLPPLREHREDIPLLIDHFLEQQGGSTNSHSLPADVLQRFYRYDWPGNVRELHNELTRYSTTGQLEFIGDRTVAALQGSELPFLQKGQSLGSATEAFERFYITQSLESNAGHRGKTAEELGVDRKTLYKKLKRDGDNQPQSG